MAKLVDFYSTTILLLEFFDKDQTSLKITRLHSTHWTCLAVRLIDVIEIVVCPQVHEPRFKIQPPREMTYFDSNGKENFFQSKVIFEIIEDIVQSFRNKNIYTHC